jgi:hypothetical protein
LFPDAAAIRQAEAWLENVVTQRKPQFGEGILLVGGNEIWSRMNFRSIRFGNERSILVVIEDLTTEKRELTLNEKYKSLAQIFPYGIAEFAPAKRVACHLPADELLSLVLGAKLTDGNSQFATLNGAEPGRSARCPPQVAVRTRTCSSIDLGFRIVSLQLRVTPRRKMGKMNPVTSRSRSWATFRKKS